MSTQQRSFFALDCNTECWAECPAIPEISLCGGNPFTLSASFWCAHKEDDSVLFRQPGVFTLGAKDGSAYFQAKNLGTFRTNANSEPKLLEDEWNQVDVVYDGKKVQIFLQGILVLESEAAGQLYLDGTTRCQLGVMSGYLQEVALYRKALTEAQVLQLPFTHAVEKEQTELWADFDAFAPKDKGRHALPLQLKGSCTTVNLVYALQPSWDGFAVPAGAGQVNPGGLPSGELTILAAVFPMELSQVDRVAAGNRLPNDEDTILFANGPRNGVQSLALGLHAGDKTPFLILGTTRFSFTKVVENYHWYQISATVKGTEVALFLDGEAAGNATLAAAFTRTQSPELMIGNQADGVQMNHGFPGCMDLVAVFDKALPQDKLKAYAAQSPYRFEEHLAALWLFSEQYPTEIVSGARLTYSDSGRNGLQENTVLDRELPNLSFAMPDVATGMDAVQTWEARVAAETVIQSIKQFTGLTPDGGFVDPGQEQLNGSLQALVTQQISNNFHIGEVTDEGKATGDNVREILMAASLGAFLGSLCYALYCTAQNGGLRKAARCKRFLYFLKQAGRLSLFPALEADLAATATLVVKYVDKHAAPDPGTCTSNACEISFQSLSFYNEASKDAGALFGVPDFGEKPVLPEWSQAGTTVTSARALYHRDISQGKNPSVVLCFTCKKENKEPVTLTFAAACMSGEGLDDVMGAPQSTSISVSESGTYSVTLPLPDHKLRTAALAAHRIRWQWRISSPGAGDTLVGKTEHTIHVLAAAPLAPWTIQKDSAYPPVYSAIQICEKIAALTSEETDANRRFAGQFVAWSHSGENLTARSWKDGSQYAGWCGDENEMLSFPPKACIQALEKGMVALGNLDCACLQCILAYLEGLGQVRLIELVSVMNDRLFLRPVRRLGAAAAESYLQMERYYVCSIPKPGAQPDIWDPFLTLTDAANGAITAAGLSLAPQGMTTDTIFAVDNHQYSTLLCRTGGSCAVGMIAERLFMEELPVKGIAPGTPVLVSVPRGRPVFDKAIIVAMPLPPYEVRCHCLSYKGMERLVVKMVNSFYNEEFKKDTFPDALICLLQAVMLKDDPADAFENTAWEKIESICKIKGFDNKERWAEAATLLMTALNNIEANLRTGKSDWNLSVSDNFDCSGWVHIRVIRDAQLKIKSATIDMSSANGEEYTELEEGLYQGVKVSYSGFYLVSKQDHWRVQKLRDLKYKYSFLQDDINALLRCMTVRLGDLTTDSPDFSDNRLEILLSTANTWGLQDHPIVVGSRTAVSVYSLGKFKEKLIWKLW